MNELTYTAEAYTSDSIDTYGFTVAYCEWEKWDERRHSYNWTLTKNDIVLATSYVDHSSRLRSGVDGSGNNPETLSRMLGTLFSFLGAWAEAWDGIDRGIDSENTDLFPLSAGPVRDAFSGDELTLFGLEIEGER